MRTTQDQEVPDACTSCLHDDSIQVRYLYTSRSKDQGRGSSPGNHGAPNEARSSSDEDLHRTLAALTLECGCLITRLDALCCEPIRTGGGAVSTRDGRAVGVTSADREQRRYLLRCGGLRLVVSSPASLLARCFCEVYMLLSDARGRGANTTVTTASDILNGACGRLQCRGSDRKLLYFKAIQFPVKLKLLRAFQ